jgi:hypothetical protein
MEDKGGEIGMAGKRGKGRGKRGRKREGAGELAPKKQNPNSAYVVDHL